MNGKVFFCLFAMCLFVGVVSADTLIKNPDVDGYAWFQTDNKTLSEMVAGNGASADSVAQNFYGGRISTGAATQSGLFRQLLRGVLSFNTSDVGSDSTINSVTLSLNYFSKSNGLGSLGVIITNGSLASNTAIAAGDYQRKGNLALTAEKAYADIATGNNTFDFNNDGIEWTSKTGYTVLFVRLADDFNNAFSGSWGSNTASESARWNSNDNADTEKKPFLTIDYTPAAGGDTTPPESISNLANSTTCNSINWTWTNPGDADFNHTYVLKDNVFYANLSNTTTTSNWTGLSGWSQYTFSSKTVDITGNMNGTWQNQTAKAGYICKLINYIRQFYLPYEMVRS